MQTTMAFGDSNGRVWGVFVWCNAVRVRFLLSIGLRFYYKQKRRATLRSSPNFVKPFEFSCSILQIPPPTRDQHTGSDVRPLSSGLAGFYVPDAHSKSPCTGSSSRFAHMDPIMLSTTRTRAPHNRILDAMFTPCIFDHAQPHIRTHTH